MKEEENLASAAGEDARFTTVISDHKAFITVVELAPLIFFFFGFYHQHSLPTTTNPNTDR